MHSLSKIRLPLFFSMLALASSDLYAFGEVMIDKILRSDFVYDRDITHMPFMPIGYLTATHQNELELDQCPSGVDCEFQYQSISQGAGFPVWVGQNQMLVVAETLDVDVFETKTDSSTINTGGLMAAWVSQHSLEWQSAAFAYHYQNLDSHTRSENTSGTFAGLVGRYRHGARFHSYWGAVHFNGGGDAFTYPYAGFDWFIDRHWVISAVMPWPTINYLPDDKRIFKVGALFSETTWSVNTDNQFHTQDFSQVSMGAAYEQQISGAIWGEVSIGYTGLGKLQIETDADTKITTDIANTPFIKLALNVRPF
ncbi:MAG TPA: hypothetical protein VLC79_00435, partial [Cellvibrio sp.]|nr:hypothetical protein [Cellvibrio sp.]